jgi:hypothetical protein
LLDGKRRARQKSAGVPPLRLRIARGPEKAETKIIGTRQPRTELEGRPLVLAASEWHQHALAATGAIFVTTYVHRHVTGCVFEDRPQLRIDCDCAELPRRTREKKKIDALLLGESYSVLPNLRRRESSHSRSDASVTEGPPQIMELRGHPPERARHALRLTTSPRLDEPGHDELVRNAGSRECLGDLDERDGCLVLLGQDEDRSFGSENGGLGPERWKLGRQPQREELREMLRLGKVAESVLADVTQPDPRGHPVAKTLRGVLREEYLAAVRRGADPGDAMHVESDVPVADCDGLARVHSCAHRDWSSLRPRVAREGTLSRDDGRDRSGRLLERGEEAVAMAIHHPAAVALDSFQQKVPVLDEHSGIALAQAPEEPRRPLDVGEEKRDSWSVRRDLPTYWWERRLRVW